MKANVNHNETQIQSGTRGLKVKTQIQNRTRGLKVKTGIKAGPSAPLGIELKRGLRTGD